jgi:hypothetical protein
VEATVDHLLRRAGKAERRRVVAWLLAAVPVVAVVALVGSGPIAVALAAIAALLALWSVRQVYGLAVARRDFNSAATPPRRAFVVLLHDPNPRAIRPLLAIWDERPAPGERLPKPRSVWRCDDELLELESHVGSVEVHEAWLDTGRFSWSTPRWVRGDAGIAVPHRRSIFGRWYVSTTLRRERPGEAEPLTLDDPHRATSAAAIAEPEVEIGGSLLGSLAGRAAFLAAVALLLLVLG